MKKFAIGVAIGAILGAIGTHFIEKKKNDVAAAEAETKYRQFYLDELQKLTAEQKKQNDGIVEQQEKLLDNNMTIVEETAYNVNDITEVLQTPVVKTRKTMPGIYVIDANEYNDPENAYRKCLLDYYADKALIDDTLRLVNDKDKLDYLGGIDFTTEFDEDDSAYIRNDKLEMDFLITRQDMTWAEHRKTIGSIPMAGE